MVNLYCLSEECSVLTSGYKMESPVVAAQNGSNVLPS